MSASQVRDNFIRRSACTQRDPCCTQWGQILEDCRLHWGITIVDRTVGNVHCSGLGPSLAESVLVILV